MKYQYLTLAEQRAIIEEALKAREHEHFMYSLNEVNFQTMLNEHIAQGKQEVMPVELQQYKGAKRDDVIKALPETQAVIVLEVQWADSLKQRLLSERVEKEKVEKIYTALATELLKYGT